MQNKNGNSINGVKVITRYSPATIVTTFLTFVLIAIPVVQFFFILFSLEVNPSIISSLDSTQNVISFNGLGIVQGLIGLFRIVFLKHADVELNNFGLYFSKIIETANSQVASYGITIMIGVFMLVLAAEIIIAIIDLVLFILLLFTGKLGNYKVPKNTAVAMFIMQLLLSCFGPVALVLSNKYLGFEYNVSNVLFSFVFFGVAFLVFVIMAIIYTVSFKDAVFVRHVSQLNDVQDSQRRDQQIPTYNQFSTYNTPQNNPYSPFNNQSNLIQPNNNFSNNSNEVSNPPRERKGLPADIKSISDQAFNADLDLQVAIIPNNIKSIGSSAFANCINLQVVSIPASVQIIGYNAFFNCYSLKRINFNGTKEEWKRIQRGSNWLTKAGTTSVVCLDGVVIVNPHH